MVLRRKALNQLYKEGFKSLLTDRKRIELSLEELELNIQVHIMLVKFGPGIAANP